MSYKRLTNEELNDFASRVVVQLEPTLTQQVMSLILELTEYRTKIENGTLIDVTKPFIEKEEINGRTRYVICEHSRHKYVIGFAENKAEAEAKLKELQNER